MVTPPIESRLPDADLVQGLVAQFVGHGYTVDAVVDLIGADAHRALGRNATIPARRALRGCRDPLALLTLLWPLQGRVRGSDLEGALPGLIGPMIDAGLLERDGEDVRAVVDIRPYASDDGASGWIASDLSPNLDTQVAPMRADFVLGVSSASSSLAQLTLRDPVGRALDLGTGCGVQSLHLARHAGEVVATDLNRRACAMAKLTFALNQVSVDCRQGSLYDPVAGERFDLITSNPPYVMSPPGGQRLAYREGDAVGDALVRSVIRAGAAHLAEGGVLQVLGNWAHRAGQPWQERIAEWLDGTGCDAHVVQREVLDVNEYVELWLADAGLSGSVDYPDRYEAWLDYFAALDIEAVGLGWLTLRRLDRDRPLVRIEEWPYPIEQPIGPAVGQTLRALGAGAQLTTAQRLAARWVLRPDVVAESSGRPGAADPEYLVYRQQRGFRRAARLDTATAAVLGAADGELTLGQIVAAVADLLGTPADALAAAVLERLDTLHSEGYLDVAEAEIG